MPMNIPCHIFDIDDATAERIIRKAIRKRRTQFTIRLAVAMSALVLGVAAIAATV